MNKINNFLILHYEPERKMTLHVLYVTMKNPWPLIQFGAIAQLHTTMPVVLPTTSRPSAQIKTYKSNIFLTL